MKKTTKLFAKKVLFKSLTLTAKILIGMFNIVDDMSFMRSHHSLCMTMSVSQARAYLADGKEYQNRQAYKRLIKKGWIKEKRNGKRVVAILTKSGKLAATEILLKHMCGRLPGREYCMVIFDIPEVAHEARDEFRNMLKRIGFSRHQQSVWCINKNITQGIIKIIKILKIKSWVRIYSVKEAN
jgi:CRISPR-associated endonuclease Cas2